VAYTGHIGSDAGRHSNAAKGAAHDRATAMIGAFPR